MNHLVNYFCCEEVASCPLFIRLEHFCYTPDTLFFCYDELFTFIDEVVTYSQV